MLTTLSTHLFCKPRMGRRVAVLLFGVIAMGFCVAIFDQIKFGTDPCSLLSLGVSYRTSISFGTCQLLFNLLLLLVLLALKETRRIGLGTVANMVLVGYVKDFFDWVLRQVHPLTGEPLGVCILIFIPTMALFLFAAAMYMVVDLGVAPYDAVPQVIAARQRRFAFTPVRMAFDMLTTLVGWLLGGTVGVVTVIVCFFMGPLVSALAKKCQPFFQ